MRGAAEHQEAFWGWAVASLDPRARTQAVAERVAQELTADLARTEDLARAENFHALCPVAGTTASDYLPRVVALGEGLHALAQIRFQGLDVQAPFVELMHQTRSLRVAELAQVGGQLRRLFSRFDVTRWRAYVPASEAELELYGEPDLRLVVGRLDGLGAQRVSTGVLQLRTLQDLSCWGLYQEAYAVLAETLPEGLQRSVIPESRASLEALIEAGTLYEIRVDGQWAGLIGAQRIQIRGLQAYVVVEQLLTGEFRGRGLAPVAQRAMIARLPTKGANWLVGTIHSSNEASLRTARRVGRWDMGAYVFYSVPK